MIDHPLKLQTVYFETSVYKSVRLCVDIKWCV